MRTRISGALAILAALAACKKDPTADGVGTPDRVILDFATLTLTQGDSANVTAQVVDVRMTPLEQPITFTSCDGAAATVAIDPTFQPVPATRVRAKIRAVGGGAPCIIAASTGARPDSVIVIVLPLTFNGALSSSSAAVGSTLTISSTASLKFDTSSVNVTFGGGSTPPILSKTPNQLQVLVPFSDPGPITIAGIAVTYVTGLVATLPTSVSFTATGSDPFPGANAWNTAPDITSRVPASGQSSLVLATGAASNAAGICPEDRFAFGPTGSCSMFKFVLSAPANVSFTTDWDGGSTDVDLLICSDSTAASYNTSTFDPCALDGLGGASSSKPEVAGGVTYPAGTYWFVAQDYSGGGVRNYYIKIEKQ